MSDAKSARSTQNIQDWHKRCKILNIEKRGKIHKKGVRLTKKEGLTPKVLNLHKLNIHKDIYIDKVGSNKSQKWRFRFKIDTKGSKLTNVLKAKISVISTDKFDKLGLK